VRSPAFGAQRSALVDPEAVLFVDNGQFQVRKLDWVFQQRMRPDADLDAAILQTGANRFFLRLGRVPN
jgi:hypothetical protein